MKNFLPLINTHPRSLGSQKRIFREKPKNRIFRGNTVIEEAKSDITKSGLGSKLGQILLLYFNKH